MQNRVFRVLTALSLTLLVGSSALAGAWNIDAAHSSVGFKVRHFFAKTTGNFRQFEGTIHFDPAQPEKASVQATIQATSIDTANDDRDKHLRSADFFDVEKFPTLTFQSTKVEKKGEELLVTGDLTIKGVTKSVTFPIEFHGAGPTPWGSQSAGFSAELKIDRKEFGVTCLFL
jgi:polyisoprenoid-binding protein YceI